MTHIHIKYKLKGSEGRFMQFCQILQIYGKKVQKRTKIEEQFTGFPGTKLSTTRCDAKA